MAPGVARGHAERRCSGARPQQARSSSAPIPWKGRPADCAPDLDRVNAAPGGYAALARTANSSASAADAAACQIPTRYPPYGAVWLAHVSQIRGGEEPGCTIRKEVASGRGSCVELTISASPFEPAGLRRAALDALGEVPTQVADDMLLALVDEVCLERIERGAARGQRP
jgi:hypothetical protein